MSKLQIKVFGNPEVRHEGRVVKFRSRKVLALLLYLAVEGQKIAREKMSAMLWSESDETSARATLRRALADLRSALDDAPTHTHLIVERDALGFAFVSSDELDIRIVDEAMKLLRISSENTVAQYEVLRKLQQAVQVYRGRFLEGFSLNDAPDFDNWVSEQRAAWQRCMSILYERLAQMQAEQGDVIASIETTNRWLAHDPLQERAYQHLMSLYLTQGNYRAALNVYAQCRNVLAEELHALPLPETQALAERVRRASIMSMRTEAVQPKERKKNFSGEEVSFQVALNTRMVGRSSEHLALVKSYQAIRQGQTNVTFITGEAGIGKTRLAREFLSWARMQGADILQARAFENSGRLPYQPLVESFRPRLERENAPDDLLSDTWLAELTRLFPEMRDRYPDLPVPAEDETIARMRLYEAIVRLSEAFTRKAPVVLALDDLHWADVATLDVLYYAARRWHQSHVPILLLLNLRSENLASTNSLADWMENLKRDMEVTLVHLEALPFEATLQLLETLSFDSREQSSIEQFAHWFFGETGGQPLYVTETLKALVERGMLTRYQNQDGQWFIDFLNNTVNETALRHFLPPGVREVIRVRLNHLTPTSFSMLVAAAVLGRNAPFEQLCLIAGLDEQTGLLALDELLRGRFLREGNAGGNTLDFSTEGISTGTYFFTHDKIRDVVYSEAGEARRRVFHRRALTELRMVSAAERVQHALAAGVDTQAFALCITAGDEALQIFAIHDASMFYERALKLLPKLQETETSSRHLYSQLGRAYELINKAEDAERIYRAMLTHGQQTHSIATECLALSHMAILVMHMHLDSEQAAALLQQALARAELVNDKMLIADVEWHLAQLEFYRSDATKMIVHGQRALSIAREAGAMELTARSLNILAYGKKQSGLFGEGEAYAREAQMLFSTLGNRAMEADSMCVGADIMLNQGRVEEGITLAQIAYDVSKKIGNAWGEANSMYYLVVERLENGAISEALTLAERCVALTEEFKLQVLRVNMCITLGIVQRTLGSVDKALVTHQTALRLGQEIQSQALIIAAAAELCVDYALLEQWENAESLALQVATGKSHIYILVFGLQRWYVTEALVRKGHIQLALQDLEHWQARIAESPRHRIPYLRAVALLAFAQEQPDRGIASLHEALAIAEALRLMDEQRDIKAAIARLTE